MRALQLNFAQVSRPRSRAGLVFLLLGAALALAVSARHSQLQSEADELETRVSRLERRVKGIAQVPGRIDEATERQVRQANEVIDQLALPWDRLFRAVEGAATARVVLLGISPDGKAGTVQITGEAADPEAMFEYVQRLERQPELERVFLLQHQREPRHAGRPLRFVAAGSWIEPRAKF
jgi:uncharacterized protein YgbK (DUF1537 family)